MTENICSNIDMFGMLSDDSEEKKKSQRKELLASTGVKDFFEKGDISIEKRICQGIECKLCINACPTNALFWQSGEVKIVKDLCVYCGACVLCCMLEDCIKIKRIRKDGKEEKFSKPKELITFEERINTKKRVKCVRNLFPAYRKEKRTN